MIIVFSLSIFYVSHFEYVWQPNVLQVSHKIFSVHRNANRGMHSKYFSMTIFIAIESIHVHIRG